MAGRNQHVIQRDKGWAVKGEGNSRDTSHHSTQAEAAQEAREIAQRQNSEVLIHGRNGKQDIQLEFAQQGKSQHIPISNASAEPCTMTS